MFDKIKSLFSGISSMISGGTDFMKSMIDVSPTSPSSMRFSFLFIVIISNLAMWGGVIGLIIYHGKFPEMNQGLIELYGLANIIAFGGKVWQKGKESSLPNETDPNAIK